MRDSLWQRTFLSFYREFPQILGELTRAARYDVGFELWKPIGDELIFTSAVKSEQDIFVAVRLWLQAMQKYESNVLRSASLATKGGAFVASFPGPDCESSIPRDPTIENSDKGVVELNDEALADRSENYLFDYFGPSIDTGFRVVSASTQRYFTMTIEVVGALAQCNVDAGVNVEKFALDDLVLLDTRAFKGVWDGREYPLFALDRQRSDLVNLALAKLRDASVAPIAVVNLCRECLALENWPSALYLPQSAHDFFRVQPVDSLAGMRSNSMEGAESVPPTGPGAESLEADAPLEAPRTLPAAADA